MNGQIEFTEGAHICRLELGQKKFLHLLIREQFDELDRYSEFLRTPFTAKMREFDGMENFSVGTAMMLDGGSNVQFIWRKLKGWSRIEQKYSESLTGKPVATLVRSYAP